MSKKLFEESFFPRRHLLAFSGGPDSVYLLKQLHSFYKESLPQHVELAYVNYHDSPFVEEEEKIVLLYQERYGLVLHQKDVRREECEGNFEDWARKIRYSFFRQLLSSSLLDDVLTAHHQDDSIETYLLQKERGNLPLHYGLDEKTEVFGYPLLRPLLSVTKAEIYHFLQEEKLPYYEDCTNHDDHTKRNLLRKASPLPERDSLLLEMKRRNEQLSSLFPRFRKWNNVVPFSFYDSLTEEEKRRFLFFFLDENLKSISPERKEGLAQELFAFLHRKADGCLSLPEKALYRTKTFFFLAESIAEEDYEIVVTRPAVYQTPFFRLTILDSKTFHMPSFPFLMRNNRRGDKIETDLVSKDVHTFLKRQKVPFYYRKSYPVFLFDGKILFVPFYKDILDGKVPLDFTWPETDPSRSSPESCPYPGKGDTSRPPDGR